MVAKVARLTSNGEDVGPASYNPVKVETNYAKPAPIMKLDRSARGQSHLAGTATESGIGPGSYENTFTIDRSTKNGSFPRAATLWRTVNLPKKRIKNRGSIRADYEEGDTTSEEGPDPGPGKYLKNHHVSEFGQMAIFHNHPEQFGKLEDRFLEYKNTFKNTTKIGPGHYLSQNVIDKFQTKKGVEGTSLFKGPPRAKANKEETPGPSSY